MATVDQSGIVGKTRDRPIVPQLEELLREAARRVGVATVYVVSGGQPGSHGRRTGSTRHDGGRAADLKLLDAFGTPYVFNDTHAPSIIADFVTECAALGANGIGAGVEYMGNQTLHIGYGLNPADTTRLTWGEDGKSVNSPAWLTRAAALGWNRAGGRPAPLPPPRPTTTQTAGSVTTTVLAGGGVAAAIWSFFGWVGVGVVAALALFIVIRILTKRGK